MQVKLTSGQVVEAVQVGGNVFQVVPKGRKPLHRGSFTILNPTACTNPGCGDHTDHITAPDITEDQTGEISQEEE